MSAADHPIWFCFRLWSLGYRALSGVVKHIRFSDGGYSRSRVERGTVEWYFGARSRQRRNVKPSVARFMNVNLGERSWIPTIFQACTISPSRSEEHTSELQSLMRTSYAFFCLKKNKIKQKS